MGGRPETAERGGNMENMEKKVFLGYLKSQRRIEDFVAVLIDSGEVVPTEVYRTASRRWGVYTPGQDMSISEAKSCIASRADGVRVRFCYKNAEYSVYFADGDFVSDHGSEWPEAIREGYGDFLAELKAYPWTFVENTTVPVELALITGIVKGVDGKWTLFLDGEVTATGISGRQIGKMAIKTADGVAYIDGTILVGYYYHRGATIVVSTENEVVLLDENEPRKKVFPGEVINDYHEYIVINNDNSKTVVDTTTWSEINLANVDAFIANSGDFWLHQPRLILSGETMLFVPYGMSDEDELNLYEEYRFDDYADEVRGRMQKKAQEKAELEAKARRESDELFDKIGGQLVSEVVLWDDRTGYWVMAGSDKLGKWHDDDPNFICLCKKQVKGWRDRADKALLLSVGAAKNTIVRGTLSLSVPEEFTGMVIGKSGANIKRTIADLNSRGVSVRQILVNR